MSKKYIYAWLFATLAIFMIAAIGCDESQSSEISRLEREVEDLENENQLLWEQTQQTKQAPAEPWRSLENWNRIRLGMTRNQIIELFGHPHDKRSGYHSETWHYGLLERSNWERANDIYYSTIEFKAQELGTQLGIAVSRNNPMIYGELLITSIDPPSDIQ